MEKKRPLLKLEARSGFHILCYAAGFMHLTFLITFMFFGLYMMVCINVVSVLLYVISGTYTMKHNIEGHALGWIIAMFAEILIHAVIVTVIQGTEVFFFLYPLMAFPLYGYYLWVYCNRDTFIKSAVAFGMITFFSLVIVLGMVETIGSLYVVLDMHTLSHTEIIILRFINVTYTLVMVIAFVLIFFLEVTSLVGKLKESNEQLNYIATHDALTGLNNRHSLWAFFDELEKSGERYCVVMGDLDDFKKINDTYGHDCGDVVLKSVASIIIENTNDGEMACRWGGEEMLIVMRGSHEDCFARISVVKSEISSLGITSDGKPVKVTMTFGFADSEEKNAALALRDLAENTVDNSAPIASPHHHQGIDSLISMVDKRLYIGKRSGKNVIVSTM
ncbi:MAG: GGDEF domain-containing protein [Lachnospiraceae bacterium]|nr:GGDEF domain-containing protein [Ruminococcus sp.]MCM1274191.1 GGDEF domain-containing protein [Lachnospiraceae bacterium]